MVLKYVIAAVFFVLLPFISLTPAFAVKTFYDDRVELSRKRVLICFGSAIAYLVYLLLLVLLTRSSVDISPDVYTALSSIPMLLVFFVFHPIVFLYRYGMRKMYYIEGIIMFFIVYNIYLMCAVAASVLIIKLLQIMKIMESGIDTMISVFGNMTGAAMLLALFIGLIVCIWLYVSFVRKKVFLKLSVTDTVLFLVYYSAAIYSFVMITARSNESLPPIIRASEMVVVLVLLFVMPLMIIRNRQTSYYSEMSTRNEQFLEAELVASNAYKQSQEDTRAFRHDMNNNLSLVSAMMKKGQFTEAEEYINGLCGKLSSFSPRVVTGDDMLDSLISSKLPAIEKKGIRFMLDGVIDGGIGWKPIDICAVFANMLDNAVEACEKVTGAEKYISVTLRKTELQRIITVRNSSAYRVDCAHLGDGSHYTSKTDRSRHGFGVKNIKDTAEKNGAMVRFESSDTEFAASVIIMRSGVRI